MPSARKKEIEESSELANSRTQVDLQPLLRESRSSHNGNLNVLYGRGRVLFAEGEPARGIYILLTGRVAVSVSSSEGRIVMLRMAQAGDVLGLNSVLRNCPYDTTVKTLEPCRADFISRSELIKLMERSGPISQTILDILSVELSELTVRAKLLLLPQTSKGRLARLLLTWSTNNGSQTSGAQRIDRVVTHEELAQMICSSRETVTRLLASLRKQQVIGITADSILIRDRRALENIAREVENGLDVSFG